MSPTKTKAPTNGSDPAVGTLAIPKPSIVTVNVKVRGTSPLICHKWSDKAKKAMLDKQMKKASKGREAKDPERDYRDSLYVFDPDEAEAWHEGGKLPASGFGFPSVAFKAAAVRAGKQVGLTMTDLRCWFHVNGELVVIDGEPHMREDAVRVQQTSDIRYRGEFGEWSATIPIQLDESKLSVEQLVNLFAGAGFGVGIGEWRPERNGQYGRFVVESIEVEGQE